MVEREEKYEKHMKDVGRSLESLHADHKDCESIHEKLKSDLLKLQQENEGLHTHILMYQTEQESMKAAFEKEAELTVDDRYKVKYEKIKTYVDSVMHRSGSDLELGREIVSLKI